ncbi:MAG: ATP-binding cassette domain-containing protein, partial [Burkholderiales bacterium]
LAPVEQAIAGWKSLVDARAAYVRLDRALAAEPAPVQTELPEPKGELALERVVFGFRGQDRPIIKGVSFELAPGQALAIVGPSAAGKSTLARLIVGVWPPSLGVVRLDGADISSWPRERLGPHIGYLPQTVELFAGTVSENIARMGKIDSEAVIRAAQRANAHEMILRLPQGYDTPIGEGGSFLSAGQRQRVALARSLYGNPKLVVLDEPNSNLDNEGEAALAEAVRHLKQDGVTVIVVTHRTTLLTVADKVMLLRDGVIEKLGTLAEIFGPMRPRSPEAPATILSGSVAAKG